MSNAKLPDKLFFKIGEVAKIVGVQTHVLRYWESELPALRPMKTRGAHRMYRRKDVELAVHVRRLLHEDGLTMSGAKRKLRELQREQAASGEPAADAATVQVSERAELLVLRKELGELLKALDRLLAPEPRPKDDKHTTAVVTAAVSSTVPIGGRRGG